jgi:hypothetical protein
MTFLNWIMLSGLAAVSIPILIHLLNRSRARVVDWGAMRFLEASLASRSRRILIEEVMLLVLRCLVVALAVFAIARPFLPTRPSLLVLLFIPAVLAASICAALAAAMWASRRLRRYLLAATVLLVALPVIAGGLEQAYQSAQWSFGGGEKDVAIVLDGSLSMTLADPDGNTNFDRALMEARAVVASCGPADGVSLILAGASPRAVLGSPASNRKDIATALGDLRPVGGSMRVVPALQMASETLARGANPAKKIVLITDGQHIGWDVRTEAAWKFLGSALKRHVAPPQVIVRALPVPAKFTNAAVSDVLLDRRVVGTDREVRIDVKVESTGTEPIRAVTVKLLVDGEEAGSEVINEIPPGAAETVHFKFRFGSSGRHIVAARLNAKDDLAGDNVAERVVDVLGELPVLIVDGRPSVRPLEGAGDFLDIALAPPPAEDEEGRTRRRPRRGAEYATCLVATRLVEAPDIASVGDLGKYGVVILAEVPLLPKAFADQLSAFVRGGGGLLVAPGAEAQVSFYNAWVDASGQPVLPGKLLKLRSAAEKPARLLLNTFSHPALGKVADEDQSDAASAMITSYWQIDAPQGDRDVAVGGQIDTGEPLLLERRLGRGCVLLAAAALHPRSTSLPALKCFVPLVHELAYYLASPSMPECNVESSSDVTIELRAGAAQGGTGLKGEYFNDMNFRSHKLTRVDRRIDFDWGEKPPHRDVSADNFAVRWTGRIDPPRTGAYTFHTTSDDGVRLWVDGKRIINDWNSHGPEERSGQVKLTAGRKADIRLEYYDASSGALVKLEWSGPDLKRQVVPTSRLYNDGTVAAGQLAKGDRLEVVTPSGDRRVGTVAGARDPLQVSFTEAHQPGLYRLVLPQGVADRYAAMSPDGKGVPFAVVGARGESTLVLLSDADLQTARRHVLAALPEADPAKMLVRVEATNELTAAVAGGIPGRELWQFIAIVLVAALLAEVALTRWIAMQWRTHSIRPVAFGSDMVDVGAFRRRAEELLATDARAGEEASKS